ncbi:hypothetical protein D3C80_1527330 [compost metagenome]
MAEFGLNINGLFFLGQRNGLVGFAVDCNHSLQVSLHVMLPPYVQPFDSIDSARKQQNQDNQYKIAALHHIRCKNPLAD